MIIGVRVAGPTAVRFGPMPAIVARLALAATLLLGPAARAAAQHADPDSARIELSDVARFLRTLDALRDAATYRDSASILFERYYLPATPGLRDFIRSRIGSPFELLDQIQARSAYYDHLRSSLSHLEGAEPAIRASLRRFHEMYPDAVFADIFFLVGRMNSGGTVAPDKLLIGSEMYGRDADAPTHELNDWEQAVLRDGAIIATIVVHELMHVNQPRNSDRSLLMAALREGGADFLAELVTGGNINAHVHAWANPREAELWEEFQTVMLGADYSGWFSSSDPAERPADLAYWMGHKIAAAYYARAADKRQAIHDILKVEDAGAFLERSGYAGRSATE